MQQHTGEHILSGTLHRLFGAENVGFHIGSEAVRMDTSVPISPEGLRQAELEANRFVWRDLPVQITYPSREELAHMTYRSKKLIKILAAEHYKGGMRLAVVCGGRALAEVQAMQERQSAIVAELSAKPAETANAVRRVHDELTALKFAQYGLCGQLFEALAGAVSPHEDVIRLVPGLDPDGLHRLAARLTEATDGLCAALTPTNKGCGYCLARREGDVRSLTKALNAACGGRGGGKPGICQGSCTADPQTVENFLRDAAHS